MAGSANCSFPGCLRLHVHQTVLAPFSAVPSHAQCRYTRESKALLKISSYGTAHSQQQAEANAVGPSSPDSQGEQA